MLGMSVGAIVCALVLTTTRLDPSDTAFLMLMLLLTGGLLNAVQTTMYALAAHVYPTGIRGTGVGTAVAFGRVGGVAAPYAGSWALETGGASRLFVVIAATMTVVFAALASLRNHIPRVAPARAARVVI